MDNDRNVPERDLGSAVSRGARGLCPACGGARLFGRFLKPVPNCPACGQDWTRHSADDLPAYLVILVVGHLLAPFLIAANRSFDVAMWIQMLMWPLIALLLSLLLIQPAKGVVIAFQWARRMQGFADRH